MTITLPIYIEEQPRGEGSLPLFFARPLRHAAPNRRAEKMARALLLLESDLRNRLLQLSEDPEHDQLAEWCVAQDYETATLELRLELKSGSRQRRFFFAGYRALDRKLWFTPKLPGLHFEVLQDERLADRATAVLTEQFRELERSGEEVELDEFALPDRGKAFLTLVEIKMTPACKALIKSEPKHLSIFGGDDKKPNGEAELRKVGRLLNSLYPDELPRALGRDAEVAHLDRWLSLPDRRAILLVGPRQVGKTAIVGECVWRRMAKEDQTRRRKIWLASPMRLISGMSYVGQWEDRVQAICDYLERSDAVLYLDDLPGLFTAGNSASSEMNVAQLLKPRLEKRSLRLLAEITPEAWRVVRERDRALADLFHVLLVTEPIERETLRILVGIARECERQHRCEFALDVTPAVYELYRRFAGDAAFPGKAAEFLRRLAVKHAGAECNRTDALVEFRERSGLQLSLLDRGQTLDRETILGDLRKQVAGQDEALQAFADVLLTLKARLNDPRRPLAVFLFVGPTGVGKTECAKAFAKYLFGSADRLLRFDMNEMVGTGSGLRLTGTPAEPDGLLTGAVRRQPFSVLLFDEIEKAAPEIFDLLLGVLDEGRLSDALGRVADFTNCMILLTSNLGVLDSGRQISLGAEAAQGQAAAFVAAAEKFFRPEFFNRLDRVLPFRALQPADLVAITRKLLGDLLQRDGLRQRQCLFGFSLSAIDRLAELGRHPQLGARALKRVIEREVAQPLAEQLAARASTCPLNIELRCAGARFSLHSCELRPAERTIFWPEFLCRGEHASDAILDAAFAALDRITEDVETHAPVGRVDPGSLTPDQERYYHCREQIRRVEELLREAEASAVPRPEPASRAMAVSRPKPSKVIVRCSFSSDPRLARAREAERLQQELADSETPDQELPENPLFRAVRELAFLAWMASEPCSHESLGLVIRFQEMPAFDWASMLQRHLETLLESHWGVQVHHAPVVRDASGQSQLRLWATGVNLARLLGPALGCYLLYGDDGKLHLLEVGLLSGVTFEQWSESAARAEFGGDSTIVVTVRRDGRAVDHRTGLVLSSDPEPEEFRAFHLAGLPLPLEIAAAAGDLVN